MTIINHTLGFPRVGLRRELKSARELLGGQRHSRGTAGGRP